MRISAAVARESGKPFVFEDLELDDPREHEVLVEVRGAGLCHTDVAARDGVYGLPYPLVLGHEGSGIVRAVGSAVDTVAPGDHVAISFSSCGTCTSCAAGRPAYCLDFVAQNYIGSRPDGSTLLESADGPVHSHFFGQSSFASHAMANDRNVVKIDDDLDLALMGPLGCGLQTGAGAIMQSMACPPRSSLLVLGTGPVGLAAVRAAAIVGCDPIVVLEPHAARRALATELGATHAIDPAAGSFVDAVREIVPAGVDFVFDTTGRPDVITDAIAVTGVNATVGLVGVPNDFAVPLPLNMVATMQSGLTVKGIVEGDSDPQAFIPQLLAHYREGRFPFDRLITTFPMSQLNEAVQAQYDGEVVKVVLVPDDAPA